MEILLNKKMILFAALALCASAALILPAPAHAATLSKPANNLGLVGYWSFNDGVGNRAVDFSGNSNTGTLSGSTLPTWVAGKRDQALSFDGSTSYVDISSPASLAVSQFTICAWIKPSALSGYQLIYGLTNFPKFYTNNSALIIYGGTNQLTGSILTTDVWQHVCASNDASNTSYYLNGTLKQAPADATSWSTSASQVKIGQDPAGSTQNFPGSIDEVRVYSRVLTATEVSALYDSGAAKIKTANRNGLVGEWKFDEGLGNKALDSSSNSNTGTVTGAVWANGKLNKALNFDGVNDYVDVPDDTASNVDGVFSYDDAENFSLSLWYKGTDSTANGDIGATLLGRDDNDIWANLVLRSGKVEYIHYNAAWLHNIQSTTSVDDDVWHHIVYVNHNDATGDLFIDGTQEINGLSSAFNDATRFFTINGFMRGAIGVYTSGLIDDVKIYSRALSAAEVLGLYNSGAAKINVDTTVGTSLTSGLVGYWSFNGPDVTDAVYDRSGQGNNGYFIGGATTSATTIGKVGQALSFDGAADYVNLGSAVSGISGDDTVSLCAWFKTDTTAAQAIVITGNEGSALQAISLYINISSGALSMEFAGSNGARTAGSQFSTGAWYHFCGVKTPGAINTTSTIYLNGLPISLSTSSGNTPSIATTRAEIGRFGPGGSSYFDGTIDEVRIYNRALTAAEVTQLYLAGK